MKELTLFGGKNKYGESEFFSQITMKRGELYSIVGNTGSGKSRLIKDIEQLAQGDSVTRRKVFLDGKLIPMEKRMEISSRLVAHLGQNMRFIIDTTVGEFLQLHAQCREKLVDISKVLCLANQITPEKIEQKMNLNLLSGGQTRALMIADIAIICDSPIVLIDEIENAGIDKEEALEVLLGHDKLVLVVTHDLHTALMASKRIVMEHGAVKVIVERSPEEKQLFEQLSSEYQIQKKRQTMLRAGGIIR
ncbi:ATP-binding cassette domain-containing protein [Velocimicrobium porci]|uniref:ATP-binding cassette domain-containing protein n=1 Tax=Velocimicrobium porci TaxID=2606634 RepID=A0A6L5Y211_9FIRM|nr:ATP-binding cassette domain-containing protein [Velocimicrobium porci]MSS64143.1 ATP-binding cassette domain-containing protein [Velocimicrobium porci]